MSQRLSQPKNRTPSNGTRRPLSRTGGGPGGSADRRPEPQRSPEVDPDPGKAWKRAVEQLARRAGVDPEQLVDEHQRRSDARRYLGDDVDTANATAFEHVAARLALAEAA